MKLESTYRDTAKKLMSDGGAAEFDRQVRTHPALTAFSCSQELLQFLNGRAPELAGRRSAVVRALLALYQAKATFLAGEILFVTYYRCLRLLCRDFRDDLGTHDLAERCAMIVAAFFEAAARVPLNPDSPTALSLALKTRQLVLREVCRAKRGRTFEAPWADSARSVAGRTATPEAILIFRQTARAVDELLAGSEKHRALHQLRARKPLQGAALHGGTLSKELRAAHPSASEQELRRMHQRVRTQRSRARRATRKELHESVSQIGGSLDLWDQEGWQ